MDDDGTLGFAIWTLANLALPDSRGAPPTIRAAIDEVNRRARRLTVTGPTEDIMGMMSEIARRKTSGKS